MTRDELIGKIAEQIKCTKKQAAEMVNAFLDQILNALAEGKKVSFVGFGSFEVKQRKERKGINPQNKQQIIIPARKVPVFKAGKKLKDAVK
jgi:DNA-binding protein HU-beta